MLRSILSASDGVDRATVDMLAEEEGLDPESIASTLQRFRDEGSVRYGRGPDGEEVFAWARLGTE